MLSGRVEGIGRSGATLTATDISQAKTHQVQLGTADHRQAAHGIIDWIAEWSGGEPFQAIGHRVVHGGMRLDKHQEVTPEVLRELRQAQPLDLTHLPREIALIEAFQERFPGLPQFACFDTVFGRALPRVAQLLPIPRRYADAGIRRLGFHGLSYAFLMEELQRVAGTAAEGRVVLAHLGSGASMTALHRMAPVDTSMAFTPASGIMMGTRPGDLDPGLLVYLIRTENLTPEQLDDFVSCRCGLLGVSQHSADMRELVSRRAHDECARDAFDLFCYQAKKWIGAGAAALGGLETLVFSGGIGEHSPEVRAAICEGLRFLGIELDATRNSQCIAATAEISRAGAAVTVRVIPTDEELTIARIVSALTSENPTPQGGGTS